MQKHLSAVSQMVAKIVATRADYEVTRQAVNRKNPAEDSDWDRKVEALRYTSCRVAAAAADVFLSPILDLVGSKRARAWEQFNFNTERKQAS